MEDDLHWKMTYKYSFEFPILADLTGFGIVFLSEVKKIWSWDILLFPCLHRYVVNKPSSIQIYSSLVCTVAYVTDLGKGWI